MVKTGFTYMLRDRFNHIKKNLEKTNRNFKVWYSIWHGNIVLPKEVSQ
jgi:hypothetical protein